MLNKNAECFQNEKAGLFHNILKVLKKKKQLSKKNVKKIYIIILRITSRFPL